MLLFIICEAPQNNFIIFWPIFDHFYPISPAIFVLEQKFGIDDLRDPPILDQLGKERKKSVSKVNQLILAHELSSKEVCGRLKQCKIGRV